MGGVNYKDIQAALDAAKDNDEIIVCNGAFSGGLSIETAVTLRSLNGSTESALQGDGKSPVLTIHTTPVTIEGFTIESGGGKDGAGILAEGAGGAITITGCNIRDNNATARGGAVLGPENGTLLLPGTTVDGNAAIQGGGVYGWAVTLTESTLSENTATTGGGLYLDAGTASADADTTIRGNDASNQGGGI